MLIPFSHTKVSKTILNAQCTYNHSIYHMSKIFSGKLIRLLLSFPFFIFHF